MKDAYMRNIFLLSALVETLEVQLTRQNVVSRLRQAQFESNKNLLRQINKLWTPTKLEGIITKKRNHISNNYFHIISVQVISTL